MALYKRGRVWWMRLTHNGKTFRRSTDVTDKKLAEKIHAKVITQIAEEKWFDRPIGGGKKLSELFERYISEYSVPNKAKRTIRQEKGLAREMLSFFGDVALTEITPRSLSE